MRKSVFIGRYRSPDKKKKCNLYQDAGGIFYYFRMKKRHISDFNKWREIK